MSMYYILIGKQQTGVPDYEIAHFIHLVEYLHTSSFFLILYGYISKFVLVLHYFVLMIIGIMIVNRVNY